MNKKIAAVLAVGVVIGGLVLYMGGQDKVPSESQNPTPAVSEATVTYTDDGYSPSTVTIARGASVRFVNNSSVLMWVGSAMHPTHEVYDGTALSEHCAADYEGAEPFDSCVGIPQGESWSFTFNKAGTWNYHDHLTAGKYGKVVVQ